MNISVTAIIVGVHLQRHQRQDQGSRAESLSLPTSPREALDEFAAETRSLLAGHEEALTAFRRHDYEES